MAFMRLGEKVGIIHYSVPPLQYLTSVNTDVHLWNSINVKILMKNFRFEQFRREDKGYEKMNKSWKVIEDTVINNVSVLPIPKLLKNNVLSYVKPIGLEMMKWKEFHELECDEDVDFPNVLCWTPHGVIDRKKTAEMLVNDANYTDLVRFKVACIYCMENHIVNLWNKVPDQFKSYVLSQRNKQIGGTMLMPVFWTCVMEKVSMNNIFHILPDVSLLQFMFEHTVFRSNQSASEYFWAKLGLEERRESLERLILGGIHIDYFVPFNSLTGEYHNSIVVFLMSLMNEQQQRDTFRKYSCSLLLNFLCWPLQDLFIQVASHLWGDLSFFKYRAILEVITEKVGHNYQDYDYQMLFSAFWTHSPERHKRRIIRECSSHFNLLRDLFMIGDKENIQLIFKHASVKEQRKIISYLKRNRKENLDGAGYTWKPDEKEMTKKLIHFLKPLLHPKGKK